MNVESMPLVSYFIPSFNHAQYVSQAVESVLSQEYPNLELIVVDDGSTDDSHDVLRKYEADPRVTLILNSENRGQSAAFNQALRVANGEFIGYLPSDDWHLSHKTSVQIELFKRSSDEVGVIYGRGARFFEATGETVPVNYSLHRGWVFPHLIEHNMVFPATPMFRRECFDRVPLDENYRAEGEAFYLKLALHFQFDFVDEVVSIMRDHTHNTGKNIVMMYEDNIRYVEDFFAKTEVPAIYVPLKHTRLGYIHRLKGLELIKFLGDGPRGRNALLRSLYHRPKYLFDCRVWAGLGLSFLPSNILSRLFPERNSSLS